MTETKRGLPLPVLAIGAAAAVWWFTTSNKKPEAATAAVASTAAPGPCTISKGDVAFPSEEGFGAFVKSVARGDDVQAQTEVAVANGGFSVDTGTACTLMSAIGGTAKVRLQSGPHSGQVAFLPVERVSGR